MITPTNAFDPQITTGGLSLTVQPGSVSIDGTVTAIAQTAAALTANSTNYVYVDLASLTVTANTTGFPTYSLPVATVVTLTASIQSVTDNRADVDITNGGPLSPSVTLNNAAQSTYRLVDSEITLGFAGNTTITGSVVPVRGATTIGSTTHLIGTGSYSYGVQGKFINKGYVATTGGNGIIQCGVLAQLDLSQSLGIAAGSQVTALWVDCGAAVGTVTGSAIDVSTFYQNIGSLTVNSVFRVLAKATYLFDLSSSSTFIAGTSCNTAGGTIAVNTDAGVRYIGLFTTKV
jgi:hypothetical protein